MRRKIVVLMLVMGMVLGVFSMAAAQGSPPAGVPFGPPEGKGGVSVEVQRILEGKEEGAEGPPAFVRELKRIDYRFMERHRVRVNGEDLQSDLPPVIKEGRVLIPVRAVSNALGATVDWDADAREITITKGDVVVVLKVDDVTFYVNGEAQEFDVPAQLVSNRTFVPLRFVALALGEAIDWDAVTGTAFIGKGKGTLDIEMF